MIKFSVYKIILYIFHVFNFLHFSFKMLRKLYRSTYIIYI